MVKLCCICKLEYGAVPDVSFHNIPKSEDLKSKWFGVIGREVNKHSAVCSKHFEKQDFVYKVVAGNVKRFLLPLAVPVIHGHSDSKTVEKGIIEPSNCGSHNVSIHQLNQTSISETSNATSDYVSTLQVDQYQSSISESNSNIDSHYSESTEGSESHGGSEFNILPGEEINDDQHQNETVGKNSNVNFDEDVVENHENETTSKKSSLKRKSSDNTQSPTPAKRIFNPRYLRDFTREDFTSDVSYNIFKEHVKSHKEKCKVLNQKVRRLSKKVDNLQSMLDHLKENGMVTEEGWEVLTTTTLLVGSLNQATKK